MMSYISQACFHQNNQCFFLFHKICELTQKAVTSLEPFLQCTPAFFFFFFFMAAFLLDSLWFWHLLVE